MSPRRPKARRPTAARAPLAALAAALLFGVAACGGSDDDPPANLSGGSLTLGIASDSFTSQVATRVAIDEGFYTEEGIEGVEVITAEDQIRRLRDGDVDIIQGDTGALLAAANRTGLEEEAVLLLGGYRAKEEGLVEIPVESIATTADFLDGNVGLVYGYLAAQLKAREFIYDEANTEAVLEIMEANGFELTPALAAAWDRERTQVSEDGGFSVEGMAALVRSEQAQGRLPAHFRWEEHFNPEALLYTQKEAGLAHNPQERELPSRPEKRVEVG